MEKKEKATYYKHLLFSILKKKHTIEKNQKIALLIKMQKKIENNVEIKIKWEKEKIKVKKRIKEFITKNQKKIIRPFFSFQNKIILYYYKRIRNYLNYFVDSGKKNILTFCITNSMSYNLIGKYKKQEIFEFKEEKNNLNNFSKIELKFLKISPIKKKPKNKKKIIKSFLNCFLAGNSKIFFYRKKTKKFLNNHLSLKLFEINKKKFFFEKSTEKNFFEEEPKIKNNRFFLTERINLKKDQLNEKKNLESIVNKENIIKKKISLKAKFFQIFRKKNDNFENKKMQINSKNDYKETKNRIEKKSEKSKCGDYYEKVLKNMDLKRIKKISSSLENFLRKNREKKNIEEKNKKYWLRRAKTLERPTMRKMMIEKDLKKLFFQNNKKSPFFKNNNFKINLVKDDKSSQKQYFENDFCLNQKKNSFHLQIKKSLLEQLEKKNNFDFIPNLEILGKKKSQKRFENILQNYQNDDNSKKLIFDQKSSFVLNDLNISYVFQNLNCQSRKFSKNVKMKFIRDKLLSHFNKKSILFNKFK